MFGWLKRILGRGNSGVEPMNYRAARRLIANSGSDDQVAVFLNPLIWHLGAREKQKAAALTEAEVRAIRDEAKCMVMSRLQAQAFYDHLDGEVPIPRINPERCWQEWQKLRREVDRYMPG